MRPPDVITTFCQLFSVLNLEHLSKSLEEPSRKQRAKWKAGVTGVDSILGGGLEASHLLSGKA